MTLQVKSAATEMSGKHQALLGCTPLTKLPMTTKKIADFDDHPSEWITTETVTPLEKFTETASLLISHSKSTIICKKIAVRLTKATETPYLLKENTQFIEFFVITPGQSKFIKLGDSATLSIIPDVDPNLTTFSNKLLRTNKPEQQRHVLVSRT